MKQQMIPRPQDAVYDFSILVNARTQRIAREYLALKDAESAAIVAETLYILLFTLHEMLGIEPPAEPNSVRYVRTQREALVALDFEAEEGR